jgi:hypothetical protein
MQSTAIVRRSRTSDLFAEKAYNMLKNLFTIFFAALAFAGLFGDAYAQEPAASTLPAVPTTTICTWADSVILRSIS